MWITMGTYSDFYFKMREFYSFRRNKDVDKRMWIKLSTSFYPQLENEIIKILDFSYITMVRYFLSTGQEFH